MHLLYLILTTIQGKREYTNVGYKREETVQLGTVTFQFTLRLCEVYNSPG